jgi:plastocyanin
MTEPNERTTRESRERTRSDWFGVERRRLLRALGVGTALPLGSSLVTASREESNVRADAERATHQIDPVFGYPTTDIESIPASLQPDHEVELHREFPENPENPERPSVFHFEPSGLQIHSGDIVQFTYTSPNHTISPYHPDHGFQRRVPKGVPPFSSPLVAKDGAWLYRFDHEGVYDLFCGVHEVTGMVMRIVVGDLSEGDVPAYVDTFEAEPPLFPPVSKELLETELNATSDRNKNVEWTWLTAPEVLKTNALNPRAVQENGSVSFEAVASELGIAFDAGDEH